MATPDIGSTISEAYSKGLDRVGGWAPALAVVGLVAGVIAGVTAEIQAVVLPDAGDIFRAVVQGDDVDVSDLRLFTLIGAVGTAIQLLILLGTQTLFSGRAHAARHDRRADAPSPGSVIGSVFAAIGRTAPKIHVFVGAVFLAQVLGVLLGAVGTLLSLALYVFVIMVWVRWIYAWVIAGSGEGDGDTAFDHSERTVAGSWWPTFGVWIVVSLATLLPVGIAAMIAGAIVPTAFGSALAATVVQFVLGVPLFASAMDSGWSQLEGSDGDQPDAVEPPASEPTRDVDPPSSGPFV